MLSKLFLAGASSNEIANGCDCNQGAAGALSPNADHW